MTAHGQRIGNSNALFLTLAGPVRHLTLSARRLRLAAAGDTVRRRLPLGWTATRRIRPLAVPARALAPAVGSRL